MYRSIHNIPKIRLPKYFLDSDTIIFGSVDIYDEQVIFPAIAKLFPNGTKSLKNVSKSLIIVPHENDNNTIRRLGKELNNNNFHYILSSDIKDSSSMHQSVILVNQIGILAELYKYSNTAYVGGGFKRGVHSVLEPAIYNCSLLCGPNIEMLDEAKTLLNNQCLHIIANSKALYQFLASKNIAHANTSNLFIDNNSSKMILNEVLC